MTFQRASGALAAFLRAATIGEPDGMIAKGCAIECNLCFSV